jgi:autotransporter-associated beta strand protein
MQSHLLSGKAVSKPGKETQFKAIESNLIKASFMKKLICTSLVAVAYASLSAIPIFATNDTWTGTGSGADWSATGNWSAAKPGASDTAIFSGSGTNTVSNSVASQVVMSITFTGGANSYTIGNPGDFALNLTAGGSITIGSTMSNTGLTETFNTPLGLGGNYTFANNDADSTTTLVFNGTITGSTATSGTLTLSGSNTGNNTINGAISNGSMTSGLSVAMTGTDTWVLAGSNSYTGATSVTGGTLILTGTLSNTAISVSNATALFSESSAGTITGTTGFALSTGSVTLAGANTYTGATAITGGTFTLSGGLNNTAITVNSASALFNETSAGTISGTSGFTLTSGTVNLAGANTYTGTTTVANGTLNLSGTLNGGNYVVNNAASNLNETSGGVITGTGDLSITNGVANLAGTNTYSGVTYVNGGTVNLSGSLSSPITVKTGTFNESGTGVIAGSSLTSIIGGTVNLNDANSTTGGFTMSSGALNLGNAGALGAGTLTLTGGTLNNTSGGSLTLSTNNAQSWGGTFIFTGTNFLDLGNGAVTMTANSGVNVVANTLEEDGNISGAYNFTKTGSGTLDLGGASTFSGTLVINTGVVDISGTLGSVRSVAAISIGSAGELMIDDRGIGAQNTNRVSDTALVIMANGSTLLYEGTNDPGASNSTEKIGPITTSGIDTITVQNNGTGGIGTKLTAASVSAAGSDTGGVLFVNGNNLGSAVVNNIGLSNSVPLFVLSTAPTTLYGTTVSGTSGINSSAQNTVIDPFAIGESGTTSGANGTTTGTANTFLTYNGTTGFRPLNIVDEYAVNKIVSGDNTYITTGTISTLTSTINSLVINGGNLAINSGTTLTDSSGGILFVTSNSVSTSGGTATLNFGSNEGVIIEDAGVNATISANIAGTGGLLVNGFSGSSLTLTGSNSYSGNTAIGVGSTLAIGSNNALGNSTILSGGGVLKSDNQARTINNTYSVYAGGGSGTGIGGSNDLTFAAPASGPAVVFNVNQSSQFTVTNTGTTSITGTFSLNNNTSGAYYNNSEGITVGSGANVVVTGSITDNNSGNVTSGQGSVLQLVFKGLGGNITILGNNGYGGTGNTISFSTLSAYSNSASSYNTVTVGGPGGSGAIITPFGTTGSIYSNGGTAFLVAAGNNQILPYNWTFGGSANNLSYAMAFAGTNSLTLSGNIGTPGNELLNIAAPSAVLTLTGTVSSGMTLGGSGNTTFGSTSTQTGATFTHVGTGTVTLSGTTTMTGSDVFTGGTVILDYSTNNNNKLAQNTSGAGAANLSLAGVNLVLNGGSYAQALGTASSGTNGTTIANSGQSSITRSSGSSTIALGAITRAAGSGGAINFQSGVALTTSTGSNGILGGYATVNGTDWAANSSGTIVAYSGYTALSSSTLTSSANYYFTGASSLTTSATAQTINSLKIDASGTLVLGNTLTISTGGLLYTGSSAETITGSTIQAASSTTDLVVQQYGSGTLTISSVIGGGSDALTKAGTGTLVLTAANSYTGTTIVDQGVLQISADNNLGSGTAITLNGGTLDVTTGFTSSRTIAVGADGGTLEVDGGTLVLNGVISGGNAGGYTTSQTQAPLTKTGSGTLVLNGADTIYGPITISAGTLQMGSATALGASSTTTDMSSAPVTVNGGTLDIAGQKAAFGNITLASGNIIDSAGTGSITGYSITLQSGLVGASIIDLVTTGSEISTSTDVTKSGAGTAILTGNNTYSGATVLSGGTLQVGNGGTTGSLGSANVNTGEVAGTSSGTLAFDRSNTYTVANAISGAGAVTQIGSGTTVLTGNNSYTGGTTISSGTLVVSNTSGSGTGIGALKLNNGAALGGNGIINSTTNTINGNLNVGSGGTNTTDVLTMTASSSTTFAGATLTYNLSTSGITGGVGTGNVLALGNTGSVIFDASSSTLTINLNLVGSALTGATQYVLFNSTDSTDPFSFLGNISLSGSNVISGTGLNLLVNGVASPSSYMTLVSLGGNGYDIDVEVQSVPEPGTWALMLGGLALLIVFQRSRRSNKS